MGKKQTFYPQKGGYFLKLRTNEIIIPTKDQGNAHFFELVNNPSAIKSISLISDSSNYSFVFRIEFNKNYSKFLDSCGEPVNAFAIKIGFIKSGERFQILGTDENRITPKSSTTREDVEKEAAILRKVWETSQQNGYKMVCPIYTCGKVGKFYTFEKLILSINKYLPNHSNCLRGWVEQQDNWLGVIVMQEIKHSESLVLLYENQSRDENVLSKKVQCLASIWASVMFLALKHSIINADLHLNNFLRNKTTDEIIMIDFGSCCWLLDENLTIEDEVGQLFSGLVRQYPGQIKVENVWQIISDISHLDFMINENKKQQGKPAYAGSTPLMDRLNQIRSIIGWDQSSAHPIFKDILEKYNSLIAPPKKMDKCSVEPPENEHHSLDTQEPDIKKTKTNPDVGGTKRTRRKPTHNKRRRKRTRRKRTQRKRR